MKRIFGTKKEKPPTPTIDEASGRLTTRGDTLDDKIRKLDEQLMKHRDAIKKTRPGPAQDAAKRRALSVLKQKKLYENQREQLYNQQFNMEETSFALESIKDTAQTVQAMKAAGSELKTAFKKSDLDINSIEKLQDEMADLMDMHNELQDVMGQSFGVPDDIDEDDLMGELDALEDELAQEAENPTASGVPSYLQETELPEAPAGAHAARPQAVAAGHQDEFGLPAVPQRT
ncbi:g3432 [Coccomyxa viridis]|uniref:G3432 protein n=1 Tax=Coccomyxa viridis TaxID=1274662 RepID=A0ABP1FT50_9CHLO